MICPYCTTYWGLKSVTFSKIYSSKVKLILHSTPLRDPLHGAMIVIAIAMFHCLGFFRQTITQHYRNCSVVCNNECKTKLPKEH